MKMTNDKTTEADEIRPTYFITYLDNRRAIERLTDEQIGMLFRAIFAFVDDGVAPEYDDVVVMTVFEMMSNQITRDVKRYIRQLKNGQKGGRPKNPNETQAKPTYNPTKTHSKPTQNPNETQTKPTRNPTKTQNNQEKEEEKEYEKHNEYSFSSDRGESEEKSYSAQKTCSSDEITPEMLAEQSEEPRYATDEEVSEYVRQALAVLRKNGAAC